jgi:carboxymethylenebutenolidase
VGTTIRGTAADGHELSIYRADPTGAPRGALVIAQEIFGVNSHIRAVCDDYAAQGYVAVAPALFDRAERSVELGYQPTT